MSERRFLLCDPDHVYVERFMEYVQKKTNFMFRLYGFTQVEQMERFLEGNDAELGLIGEEIWRELSPEKRDALGMQISCLKVLSAHRSGEEQRIFRYQSMEQLLRELVACYEQQQPEVPAEVSRTRMAAIWSPVGRCGKTTCTMMLGQCLAKRRGMQVLVVCLEDMPGLIPGLPRETGSSLSDHLYYRTAGEGRRVMSLTETVGAVSVIPPAVNPEDLWSTAPEELADLLEEIRKQGLYDWMLLDLGHGGDPMPILSGCSRILLLGREDPVSREKLRRAREYLGRAESGIPEDALHDMILPEWEELRDREPGISHEELEDRLEREWIVWNSKQDRSMI